MKFEFTDQETQIIVEALFDAPFKKVASVIQKVQQQAQNQPQEVVNATPQSSQS